MDARNLAADARSGPKLLYFFRGEDAGSRPAFGLKLEERGWEVDCIAVSDGAPARGLPAVFACPRRFSAYDVVAASEYYLTWAVCLRAIVSRCATKIVALTFNQSGRLLLTGVGFIDALLNRVWRRAALFLVHSKAEARIFAERHDIPADRFVFSHWGFDLPVHDRRKTKVPERPYVTMIGRNNRDLDTFRRAVALAGVEGVLVTAGYMVDRNFKPSRDVRVLTDQPLEDCLNYIAGSFAHLVLLADSNRGAGHISAVSAMLLGKPQIFSSVDTISDYLVDGFNGIAVPLHDPQAVAAAIDTLRREPGLAESLGSNGRSFALERMSNSASAEGIADAVASVLREPARAGVSP